MPRYRSTSLAAKSGSEQGDVAQQPQRQRGRARAPAQPRESRPDVPPRRCACRCPPRPAPRGISCALRKPIRVPGSRRTSCGQPLRRPEPAGTKGVSACPDVAPSAPAGTGTCRRAGAIAAQLQVVAGHPLVEPHRRQPPAGGRRRPHGSGTRCCRAGSGPRWAGRSTAPRQPRGEAARRASPHPRVDVEQAAVDAVRRRRSQLLQPLRAAPRRPRWSLGVAVESCLARAASASSGSIRSTSARSSRVSRSTLPAPGEGLGQVEVDAVVDPGRPPVALGAHGVVRVRGRRIHVAQPVGTAGVRRGRTGGGGEPGASPTSAPRRRSTKPASHGGRRLGLRRRPRGRADRRRRPAEHLAPGRRHVRAMPWSSTPAPGKRPGTASSREAFAPTPLGAGRHEVQDVRTSCTGLNRTLTSRR